MDKLVLSRMAFFGYHGVYAEENKLGQRYVVDAELHLPLGEAGRKDALEATVNYAEVFERIKAVVEGPPLKLIEAVADRIATDLLQTYTRIVAVTIRVTKPDPPFAVHFEGVTVELHRNREARHGTDA